MCEEDRPPFYRPKSDFTSGKKTAGGKHRTPSSGKFAARASEVAILKFLQAKLAKKAA